MRYLIVQSRTNSNLGMTLTEMLVAVAILSIGMLTVAGMLNDAITSLTHSVYHQRAVQLGTNLAEVIYGLQANESWPELAPADHHCEISACAPADLLAHMFYDWHRQAARLLPSGHGQFRFTDAHGQTAALIRLEWQTRGGSRASFITLAPVAVPPASP